MKMQLSNIFLSAAMAALALPAVAQTDTTTQPQTINQRKENQQDRIGQGIQTGQMTAGEAANVEKKESNINGEERDMRKLDNGHLTAADRATLNQQQNQLSNKIYQDKHNAAVQNTDPKSEVGKRAENQQDRIAQGVKSGQLTPRETANLESKDARINREVHNDRAANGGKLTGAEKAQVNHQQNKVSRQIYRDKHNGRKQ
jgi:metal-dependent amidase/aminoacylase/carboxypeptidase family protein